MRDRGAIAQLGERLDRTQEVGGSSPPSSMANLQRFCEGGEDRARTHRAEMFLEGDHIVDFGPYVARDEFAAWTVGSLGWGLAAAGGSWTGSDRDAAPLSRVVATEERGWSASLLDGDPKSPGLVDLKQQVFWRRPQGDFHDPSWVGGSRDLGSPAEVA
jgi:hypothetical protein